jgi:IPT/TIG domain
MTALVALIASAAAGAVAPSAHAKKRKKAPVITSVQPKDVAVGETLTIRGRNFIRGRGRNTVVFKRDGARAVFVKADLSTTRMMRLKVPASLQKFFALRDGNPVPTKFRLRVLARKFGKKFTGRKLSPVVSGPRPLAPPAESLADGDCDGDKIKNRFEDDDDSDLLLDVTESAIGTDPCKPDTDGDGVEDGYEFQSAKDLNNDRYRGNLSQVLPYPGKRPYPNPLFADADKDYDGDSLRLAEEQALWRYTYNVNHSAARTLAPLSYSDGTKHSLGTVAAGSYDRQQQFLAWVGGSPYANVSIPAILPYPAPGGTGPYHLLDADLSGGAPSAAEVGYFDFNGDGSVADDERDEDADGLTNYDETHGRMTPEYWAGCYSMEAPYGIGYAGPRVDDADSDGDGVLDGADDQDHDDVPNLMELSRYAASGHVDWQAGSPCRIKPGIVFDETDANGDGKPDNPKRLPGHFYGRVNPFNPCLPATNSRTCDSHPSLSGAGAPFDDSPDWLSLDK